MAVSLSTPEPGSLSGPYPGNDDVRRAVEHQEWLERVVPRTVYWAVFGTALLMILREYHWHVTGGVLVWGVVALIVARVAVALVLAAVVRPSRNLRFRRASKKLASRLRVIADLTSARCTWYLGTPGAFALTKGGDLVLVDRSTGYEIVRLTPDLIAGVSVEREVTQVTETRHSGRSVIGGVGGGIFGGWISGGRSTSVSRDVEEAYLEICYQLEPHGLARVAVVPFGSDRRGAQAACAMIARVQR
jgi:hypothetical protein